jgi:hypothetical protein
MLLGVTLALALAFAAPAWAVYGNEIDNPCFEQGGLNWEASEQVGFNAGTAPVFERPHIAYDPWPIPGAAGSLRQIVDNSKSPYWDPALNRKVATLDFDVYTTGDAYVVIGFDWWDYMGDVKPVGPAPYEELLPMQFKSVGQWTRFSVTYDWWDKPGQTHQPRWISLEVGFFGCSGTGFEAAVDDMVLISRCVPEPSSLVALSGLFGIAGLAWRRRR